MAVTCAGRPPCTARGNSSTLAPISISWGRLPRSGRVLAENLKDVVHYPDPHLEGLKADLGSLPGGGFRLAFSRATGVRS
ncbi:MAG: hypothetical protein ACOX20_10675 [Limnochordia bacterium]